MYKDEQGLQHQFKINGSVLSIKRVFSSQDWNDFKGLAASVCTLK